MCSVFTAKLQLRKACRLSWKCVIDWLIMALHERRIHITNLYYNKNLIRKLSGVSLSNFKRLNLLKSTSSMIAQSSRGPQIGTAPSSLDDCGNVRVALNFIIHLHIVCIRPSPCALTRAETKHGKLPLSEPGRQAGSRPADSTTLSSCSYTLMSKPIHGHWNVTQFVIKH
jgi:hypothetical protein